MSMTRDKLILALDTDTPSQALLLANRTSPYIGVFKASPAHVYADGGAYITNLKKLDREVFLDLKLYDIPETVARLTKQLARLGVDYLTVHTSGGTKMLEAAQDSAGKMKILGVTVLTSFEQPYSEQVLELAGLAQYVGICGIVCSPYELAAVRAKYGAALKVVTPGIRMAGQDAGSHTRTMTPVEAIKAGADHIVLGRSVTGMEKPEEGVERIIKEIENNVE